MARNCDIETIIRKNQEVIFRVAKADHGLSLQTISVDSGIPYSTVRSYAGNSGTTAIMPMDAVYALVGVIPDYLLSLLLPEGRSIVSVPDDIDHDALATLCRDYLATKDAAHGPSSPDGRDISGCEDNRLRAKAVALRVAA